MRIQGMIMVGDGEHYGGAAGSNHLGGYQGDADGIVAAKDLGRQMAAMMLMIKLGANHDV